MSLIGLIVPSRQTHPQELVDALYETYFDNHPPESRIDVVVAVEAFDLDEAEGTAGRIKVIDAKLLRVDNPEWRETRLGSPHRFLAPDMGGEEPSNMLRHMVEWTRAIANGNNGIGFLWIHKGPEGAAYALPVIYDWHERLGNIDYAMSDGKHRTHYMTAVVNRYSSQPLLPTNDPQPETGFIDLDMQFVEKAGRRVAERNGWGPEHPYSLALDRHLTALRYVRETEDRHGVDPEHERQHKVVVDAAAEMGRYIVDANLSRPDVPPQLKEMLDELKGMIDLRDQIEKPSIGFRPPKDVMSLPQFQLPALDNAKKPDKDRLN